MKKIIPIKIEKIWGYEIWLNSSLKENQTRLEDGELTTEGPLIKIIKANDKLSVQVHPDDYWAKELENQDNGKSESWYILEAEKESELIVGIKTLDHQLIKKKLNDKTFEELLIKTNAKKDDFINVPAGMVHGIGKNITIFEVQQPSDITYRYFDYYRKDNNNQYRELHIEKALKVQKDIDYNIKPVSLNPLTYITGNYIQKFYSNPSICLEKSIVVDLINYEAYIFETQEEINFKKYCTINI
jgi:mannose-6-phosphate isomerase